MHLRVLVLACAIVAGGTIVAAAAAGEAHVLTGAQTKAVMAKVNGQPVIFFVVKGGPNACGTGCSEWIAAEGAFDLHAGKRFKEFLESLPHRDLPIFFNSIGGSMQQAKQIAFLLRANRMRAGVAHTLPAGCRSNVATDETCRRTVQSKNEVKAQFVTHGAKCSSACGFALAGASFRQVSGGAQIGIHSTALPNEARGWTRQDLDFSHKRFLIHMGVDPGFVDLTNTVPFHRLRPMSRDEIGRLGVETRGFYETPWMIDKDSSRQFTAKFALRKSVTQAEIPGSIEYRTTRMTIGCPNRWGIPLTYRRDLSKGEGNGQALIRLSDKDLELPPHIPEKDTEVRFINTNADLIRKVAAEPKIEIAEKLWLQGEFKPRVTKLSTAGLSSAFDELLRLCEANKQPGLPTPTPAQAVAR